MQNLPHHYRVAATAGPDGGVALSSSGLPDLESAPPAEYGGPGDKWSPETLLVAAVADCFVLTFRAIAKASKFEWAALACNVEGVLDREGKVTRFVDIRIKAVLDAPAGTDDSTAERLLEKAEETCLITQSLKAKPALETEVRVAQ